MSEDEFDFVKGFADANLLEVEAVGRVIGAATTALFKGMVAAGLSEEDAHRIVRSAFAELVRAALRIESPPV
jgi:hypothetical protein